MSPLIEIDDPAFKGQNTILIDVRGGADAYQRYLSGHLTNAAFADLDQDLSEKPADAAVGGRHPLPPIEVFARLLGDLGVTPSSTVIVYDDKSNAFGGARLWWMLRSIGHENVRVLNGGLQSAVKAGLPLSTNEYQQVAVDPYPVKDNYAGTVDIDQTGTAASDRSKLVIDVRETPRYLGQTEPIDLIAGHIPGAINLPYVLNLDAECRYLPADQLHAAYIKAMEGIDPADVIVHCGSGVTACHTLLGMELAGITGPRLYIGSWSEWSRRDLPIATDNR